MKSVRLLAGHKWVSFSITAISCQRYWPVIEAASGRKQQEAGSSREQEAAGSSSRKLARHPIADVD